MRGRQQMQHRISRTAHGDIQRHRVFEGFEAGNGTRQDALVPFLVIAAAQRDGEAARAQEQLLPIGMSGKLRPVARQ